MIIVLEGADGSGKSTITQCLHNMLPLSNIVKLSGAPKHIEEQNWMKDIYTDIAPFLKTLGKKSIIIMDRGWPSEWVYAPLFKNYMPDYIEQFQFGLHKEVEICYVYLDASPKVLHERIVNEKAVQQPREEHPDWGTINKIVDRYNEWYNQMSKDFTAQYIKINVDDMSPKDVSKKILKLLGIKCLEKETTYSSIQCPVDADEVNWYYSLTGVRGAELVEGMSPDKTVRSRGFEHVREEHVHISPGFIPQRATENSAGYDFKTPIDIWLKPGERINIPTNIKAYMLPDEVLEIHIRSSLGIRHGIILNNSTSLIDARGDTLRYEYKS